MVESFGVRCRGLGCRDEGHSLQSPQEAHYPAIKENTSLSRIQDIPAWFQVYLLITQKGSESLSPQLCLLDASTERRNQKTIKGVAH